MGRDLVETGRGWCYKETVSDAYGRVSRFFKTKEDALQCLTDNGYHPQLVEMLREREHVPSLIGTSQGMYPCGLALDECLRNAGKQSMLLATMPGLAHIASGIKTVTLPSDYEEE